jgi:uncharacterized caspase-like protein
MNRVRECADALKLALQPEERARAGDRIGPTIAQLEAGYALSIGISKYLQVDEQNTPLTNPYPNLRFPAADASAFHQFLRDKRYQGPELLVDEKATRKGIMRALDDLWKACRDVTNPLVLIFFSGHGARDADGRHYLVPHDGVRDDLFATALWSKTFESALQQIKTDRLIVFLDACHAAGMETHGVKGGACDPQSVLEDRRQGRYVVASCLANQVSHEHDGHGIFSNQLLRLLRCEKEEDYAHEDVELYGLVDELKQRVKEAAHDLPDKPTQEPWSNAEKPTDIILAINEARRKARIRSQVELLDAMDREFLRRSHAESEFIRVALLGFIQARSPKNPERYQLLFRQAAAKWKGAPPLSGQIIEFCNRVDQLYSGGEFPDYARDPPFGIIRPRAASARSEPTRRPAATSPAVPSRSPDQDASERVPAKRPSTSGGLPTSARLSDRRWLPLNDIESLLAMVRQRGKLGQVGKMKKLLIDGTSEREFKTYLESTCGDADQSWIALVDELGATFDSRWKNAYKRGAWGCSPKDIDLPPFADRLRQPDRPVDMFVVEILPIEIGEAIAEYQGGSSDQSLAEALACCLNTLIHGPSIWEQCANGIEVREETALIRSRNPQGENYEQLNRMLLEDAYPGGLRKQRRVEDLLILRRGRASGDQGGSDA